MAIHITRGNMLSGSGTPQIPAEYYGQTYIDTNANPRGVWVATAENSEGWLALSEVGHKHTVDDFSDLETKVAEIVQAQGISSALAALKGENNSWDGAWNNFTGSLRMGGSEVLTTKSSLGDLGDVNLGDTLKANALIGWDGSNFVPYEVSGASPSDGGLDFSQYIKKDTLVTDLTSSSSELALAASAGKFIMDTMKSNYAPLNHTHTGFATTNHTHSNYVDKSKANTLSEALTFDLGAKTLPLSLRNSFARVDLTLPSSAVGSAILSFAGNGGNDVNDVIIGGTDGSTAGNLTLNFSQVTIPSGQFLIPETKRNLSMPPLKIGEPGLTYVGNLDRKPALDVNGGAISGLSQLVFKAHSNSRDQAILFPRNYAGNGQPTEPGYYHYLRLSEGEMKTDTALNSEARYIELNGVRYFFGSKDPGKLAREGDVWFSQS